MNRKEIIDALKRARRGVRFSRTVKLARPVAGMASPPSILGGGAAGGAAVRPLDEADVRGLEELLPYESASPFAGRFERGDRCWGVVSGRAGAGRFEAFVWTATDRWVYVDELGARVRIPSSTAYVYELYTFPEARGRGHAKALLAAVVEDLAGERARRPREETGPENLEAWVGKRNRPSVRAFLGLGFEPYDEGWRLLSFGPFVRLLRGSVGFLGDARGREDRRARRVASAPGGEVVAPDGRVG